MRSTERFIAVEKGFAAVYAAAVVIYFVYLWLISDAAWLHPEMLGSSYYVWIHPQTDTLAAQLRRMFDWKAFDPNVNRVRPMNDVFEVLDAIARPYITRAFGPQASLLPSIILTVVSVPILFFAWARRVIQAAVPAIFLTLVLVASTAFLSVTVASLHPAKRINIILLCAALYLAQRQADDGRGYWLMLACLLISFFADELGLANYVVISLLYWREIVSARSRLIGFISLPPLFLVLVKWGLPAFYLHASVHGAWDALTDGKKLEIFGYLASPDFYVIAARATGRSLLAMVGISTQNTFTECLAIATIIALTAWLARSWHDPVVMALVAIAAASGYATLLDWYPFPHEISYLGSFNYYYHSSIGILIAVWAAFAMHSALLRTGRQVCLPIVAFCAIVIPANFLQFYRVNQLTSIIHLSPYSNTDIFRTLAAGPAPVITIHADATAERKKFEEIEAKIFGLSPNGFRKTADMLASTPLITDTQIKLLFYAYYPWTKVERLVHN